MILWPSSPPKSKRPWQVLSTAFSKRWSKNAGSVCAHCRLNLRFVNVEVGVNVLHVIVLFERLHQAQHLRGLRAGQLDGVLRYHAEFRGSRSDGGLDERFLDGFERFRRGDDVPRGAV